MQGKSDIHSEGVIGNADDLNPDISEWKKEVSDAMMLVGRRFDR